MILPDQCVVGGCGQGGNQKLDQEQQPCQGQTILIKFSLEIESFAGVRVVLTHDDTD